MKKMIFLSILCLFAACEKSEQAKEKPAQLIDYSVVAINGGATITYTLPSRSNILYVMAEYERGGKPFTERSSFYNNSLSIEGFNTTDPVEVLLYTVNREGVNSDPVKIRFEPLESPLKLAFSAKDRKSVV